MQASMKNQIEKLINESLQPEVLLVEDESWQHGGGPNAQSHYKIVTVSNKFEGMKLLARHRLIQESIAQIVSQVRAISLHTLTPDEWSKAQKENFTPSSPGCHNKKAR